jgi:hypothetical protein
LRAIIEVDGTDNDDDCRAAVALPRKSGRAGKVMESEEGW